MAKIDLRKTVYNKDQFSRVVGGREFTTFGIQPGTIFSVEDFFTQYDNLFLTIPVFGDTNSHEFLVRKSSELVGFQRTTDDIQPLLDEISSLRDQLLQTRQENINLQIEAAGGGVASELSSQFSELLAALGEQPEFSETFDDGSGTPSFVLIEDTISTSITAAGEPQSREVSIFENDNIPEDKTVTFLGIDQDPFSGTVFVTNSKEGILRYTPNRDAPAGNKVDKFTYKVVDEEGVENIGTVFVNIERLAAGTDNPPITEDDVIDASVDKDGTVNPGTVNILANDRDPDTNEPVIFDSIVVKPKYGIVEVIDPEVGIITYTPNKLAPSGLHADVFEYKIFNSRNAAAIGKVFVNIKNDYLSAPVAGDDELAIVIKVSDTDNPNSNYTVEKNLINVIENDEGLDVIFESIVAPPEYGTVTATADGIVTYVPRIGVRSSGEIDLNAWFTPGAGVQPVVEDSFTYIAKSGASGLTTTSPVKVRINVLKPDEEPLPFDPVKEEEDKKQTGDTDASGRPQEPDFKNEKEDEKKSGGGGGRETKTYNSSAETSSNTSTTGTPIFD
jgi:hypothetical protein